jgi:5-(carboxyamino)imidazole ribonucleotide synthase
MQPLKPGSTIGILGAGQLGRMLAAAASQLGFRCRIYSDVPGPASDVAVSTTIGAYEDLDAIAKFAAETDVVTYEFENVPVESARWLAERVPVFPPPPALEVSQDRLAEKRFFESLGIPTPPFAAVDTRDQFDAAVREVGLPAVLKTRRFGYDGKGQAVIRDVRGLAQAWRALAGVPLLYEELVPFDGEVSIIGVRSTRGEVAVYPLNGNVHADGILRLTRAPFGTARLQRAASRHLVRVLEHFAYTGVLTIEFFVRGGNLIANEIAPRVHNSGHWTIEGAVTSQFENHLRAILGLPLGSTAARGHSAMVNIIGRMPPRTVLLTAGDVHLHDYGKTPRPGRKLGHCTVVERTARARDRQARELLGKLAPGMRIP